MSPGRRVAGTDGAMLVRPLVRVAVVAACVVVACSSGDGEPVAAPTTVSTSGQETPTERQFGTSPVSTSIPPSEREGRSGLMVDARLASQGSVDRFVLEFDEAVPPRWEVSYGDEPISAECTAPQVTAGAFLNVYAYPSAGTDYYGQPPRPSYQGSKRLQTDTGAIREALFTCDFEGDLTWALVLDRRLPFRVDVLESPPRLLIEVQVPEH